MTRAVLLAVLPFALAACEQQAAGPAEQGDAATGEVLAGSVSDAMIPLDQVTSQAPLAPRQAPSETAPGLDAEQPDVEPVPGIEGAPAEAPEPAAPAPDQPQE